MTTSPAPHGWTFEPFAGCCCCEHSHSHFWCTCSRVFFWVIHPRVRPWHKVCGWSMLSGNAQLFFRAIPLFTFSLPPHSILLFLDLTDPCSLQPWALSAFKDCSQWDECKMILDLCFSGHSDFHYLFTCLVATGVYGPRLSLWVPCSDLMFSLVYNLYFFSWWFYDFKSWI